MTNLYAQHRSKEDGIQWVPSFFVGRTVWCRGAVGGSGAVGGKMEYGQIAAEKAAAICAVRKMPHSMKWHFPY